jgi:hypothetical protein
VNWPFRRALAIRSHKASQLAVFALKKRKDGARFFQQHEIMNQWARLLRK